jgi:hypothetical protein
VTSTHFKCCHEGQIAGADANVGTWNLRFGPEMAGNSWTRSSQRGGSSWNERASSEHRGAGTRSRAPCLCRPEKHQPRNGGGYDERKRVQLDSSLSYLKMAWG